MQALNALDVIALESISLVNFESTLGHFFNLFDLLRIQLNGVIVLTLVFNLVYLVINLITLSLLLAAAHLALLLLVLALVHSCTDLLSNFGLYHVDRSALKLFAYLFFLALPSVLNFLRTFSFVFWQNFFFCVKFWHEIEIPQCVIKQLKLLVFF